MGKEEKGKNLKFNYVFYVFKSPIIYFMLLKIKVITY